MKVEKERKKNSGGFFIRTFILDLISRPTRLSAPGAAALPGGAVTGTRMTVSGVSLTAQFDSLTFFSSVTGKRGGWGVGGGRKKGKKKL